MATYLAFAIKEFADAHWSADKNITELSFVTYNTANISQNCTFNWTTGSKNYVAKYCDESTPLLNYATAAQFLKFNAVNIYYSNVLYYTINPTTAAKFGWTPADFFAGTKGTTYNWATGMPATPTFTYIQTKLGATPFSTVDAKLFIVRFTGDYSYLTGTVVDTNDKTACTLIFTSLNEAVCKLDASAVSTTPSELTIMMKKNSTVVFKYPFTRWFTTIGSDYKNAAATVDRFLCPYIIPGVTPPDYNIKSNEILTTTFYINLDVNAPKTAVNLNNATCPLVNIVVMSNNSAVFNGSNFASAAASLAGLGFCYVPVSSNTNSLVPFTDFTVNATLASNGSTYVYTKAKLTPRMISNWAENALGNGTIVVAFADINKSGLTGGEVAAIVIGSCVGVMVLALLATMFIRWCAYGCMAPEMVATPKMMM